jgi:hypothetical protein
MRLASVSWYNSSTFKLLHLAHSRATADATGAGVSTTTGRHAADDGGGEERCEGEPEEGGHGLAFTAASGRSAGDNVVVDVALR